MLTKTVVQEYLDAGARLVWVLNPKRKTATIYRPRMNPAILRQCDQLDGADVVPGFTCSIAEVFA